MSLSLMHLRLLLLLVATIVFASPLQPDAGFFGQAPVGSGQEKFPALDGDVFHGSADVALATNDYIDYSAVNPGSTRIAQAEDEIPEDQFYKFQKTECGRENSVCCMGDRTYFSSGVGTAWPCSMKLHVLGAGNENVQWFFDSRWVNYCYAPEYFSTCEELKLHQGYHECYSDCT